MLKRRSRVSTRFVITTSVIYALIIILIVIAFLYIFKINSNILKETVVKNNDLYLIRKTSLVIDRVNDRLKDKKIKKINDLADELKKYCSKDPDFLYIIVFSPTSDENYFKIQKKISLSPSLEIAPNKDKIVQEKKEINYLKTGVIKPVIDPVVYFSNNYYYKSIYHPFSIKKNNYIIEFLMSSTEVINVLEDYSGKINELKKYSIIISSATVIIIIITALLFFYNFSLLIKNLAGHLKKAAEGPGEVSLDPAEDDDLNELTTSFSDALSTVQKKDFAADLFRTGVGLLKETNYENAIAIFKTITVINPKSFGSYFNLGVCYAKKQLYETSLEMFNKALGSGSGHDLTLDYIAKVKRLIESRNSHGRKQPEVK